MAAAYSARQLGVPATIVVPSVTPNPTVERLKDEGATVVIHGKVSSSHSIYIHYITLLSINVSSLVTFSSQRMQHDSSHEMKSSFVSFRL